MSRTDKIHYYLDIAQTVSERGTCLKFCAGAVIVKNDQIISTGYRGAPRGRKNCCDISYCSKDLLQSQSIHHTEQCRAVQAEANAIISAQRQDMIGSTLYLSYVDTTTFKNINVLTTGECQRLIINAGIQKVIIRKPDNKFRVINVEADWVLGDDTLASPKISVSQTYPHIDVRGK